MTERDMTGPGRRAINLLDTFAGPDATSINANNNTTTTTTAGVVADTTANEGINTNINGATGRPAPGTYTARDGDELIRQLRERLDKMPKPKTKEQIQQERKRNAGRRIVASIADAGRAVANMLATSQYAPNAMTENSYTLGAQMQDRYEKLKAEREAREDEYYNLAMKIGLLEKEKEKEEYQRQQDEAAAQAKAEAEKLNEYWRQKNYDQKETQFNARQKQRQEQFEAKQKHDDERLAKEIAAGKYSKKGGGGGGSSSGGSSSGGTSSSSGGGSASAGSPHMLGTSGNYFISLDNWENDKYIDGLYDHLTEFLRRNPQIKGGNELFVTNRKRAKTASEKRSRISHFFNSGYGGDAEVGSEIFFYDDMYGRKSRKR